MDCSEKFNKALELIKAKKTILQDILNVTFSTKLEGSAEYVDDYVALIEKRVPMFEDIEKIQVEIAEIDLSICSKITFEKISTEIDNIIEENKKIISQILDIDTKNKLISTAITAELKSEMISISNQKNVNSYYQYEGTTGDFSSFDKQK